MLKNVPSLYRVVESLLPRGSGCIKMSHPKNHLLLGMHRKHNQVRHREKEALCQAHIQDFFRGGMFSLGGCLQGREYSGSWHSGTPSPVVSACKTWPRPPETTHKPQGGHLLCPSRAAIHRVGVAAGESRRPLPEPACPTGLACRCAQASPGWCSGPLLLFPQAVPSLDRMRAHCFLHTSGQADS